LPLLPPPPPPPFLLLSLPPSSQAITLVERVLYAADEAEAKGVLAEAGLAPDGSALAAPAAVGG
jgi:hypothetical protein